MAYRRSFIPSLGLQLPVSPILGISTASICYPTSPRQDTAFRSPSHSTPKKHRVLTDVHPHNLSRPIAPPLIAPKEIIRLLNLLDQFDKDVSEEVQRVRAHIHEARTLIHECKMERDERHRRAKQHRERQRKETKGADDEFWLGV